jgi:starvation-inducible DNA-binding protein
MTTRTTPSKQAGMMEGQPRLQQLSREIQTVKQLRSLPLGIPEEAIGQSVTMLNQLLADSLTLYDLYKKHHWQIAGPTFYPLHLLLDKHAEEVEHAVEIIAERIQMLGGVAVGMPFEVVERTKIERPPTGIENVPAMLARTINAHATVIRTIREGIALTEQNKDYGTNDLLMSSLLRMHEMQVWMISQHLIDTPVVSEISGPQPG